MFKDWPTDCLIGDEKVPSLNCIPTIFQNVVTAFLLFAGVVALFMLLFAGYKYVTSGGDPKAVGEAHNIMTYAIIGLIIVLISFLIINFIGYVTGVDCINNFGFNSCQ